MKCVQIFKKSTNMHSLLIICIVSPGVTLDSPMLGASPMTQQLDTSLASKQLGIPHSTSNH